MYDVDLSDSDDDLILLYDSGNVKIHYCYY